MCHRPWEKLIPDPAPRTGLSGEGGGVSVPRKLPILAMCRNEHVPRWRDRGGLAAGEVGEVCSTSSPLRVRPSHKGGRARGWWAASPEPLGKLAPKPLPSSSRGHCPSFWLKASLWMACQSFEGGNILTPSRCHESQNKKVFLKFLRES